MWCGFDFGLGELGGHLNCKIGDVFSGENNSCAVFTRSGCCPVVSVLLLRSLYLLLSPARGAGRSSQLPDWRHVFRRRYFLFRLYEVRLLSSGIDVAPSQFVSTPFLSPARGAGRSSQLRDFATCVFRGQVLRCVIPLLWKAAGTCALY